MSSPLTAIIVGAGHRAAEVYARYALSNPDQLKIVGVADPSEPRRRLCMDMYGLSADQCYHDAAELAGKGKIADAIINGTMDRDHVPTSLPLLELGYDLLLEKPFAVSEEEVRQLAEAAKRHGNKVMICHVLRYAPFYRAVFDRIAADEVGEILNIQACEHVSYHHMAVGFIRGKWGNRDACGSPMILAKCCHDLDLITWLKTGVTPTRVAGFGELTYFRPERAPEGSGNRCLVDCRIEADCPYSALKQYVDNPERWKFYAWYDFEGREAPTREERIEHLKRADNPYGRCVWRAGNDVVDHQSVVIDFADGSTATLNMIGNTARPMRKLHVIGTRGEIEGVFDDSRFVVRHFDTRPGREYVEEVVDLNESGDMSGAFGGHGGGDLRLAGDFVNLCRGLETSPSCTRIEDSINGHLVAFAAERARVEKRVVEL